MSALSLIILIKVLVGFFNRLVVFVDDKWAVTITVLIWSVRLADIFLLTLCVTFDCKNV